MASKYQVSRRTVRAALASAWPAPRKAMPPRASKLDGFKPIIDRRHRFQRILLRLDQDLHRPRICAAIVDRLAFGGNIIETGTDSYRRAQTRAERP